MGLHSSTAATVAATGYGSTTTDGPDWLIRDSAVAADQMLLQGISLQQQEAEPPLAEGGPDLLGTR
eukprot:COSAG01_NODE_29302_length_640_cov_4.473198_2_plen_66_part_00